MIELNFTFFIQVMNFLLLMVILNKILYKPILKILNERDARVGGGQQAARKFIEDGQDLLKSYNQKLYNAKVEAMNTKNAARGAASEQANVIIDGARRQAEQIMDEMQQEMTKEMGQAKKELEPELGVMAATIAQQILGRKVA